MFDSTYHVILTIIGIGFIIFVHELGHYLAARAVGIRVEAFAIGFGPRLFGWTRGPTDYKLCLIPLGGYVKMAGEDPTKPTTGQPDEFGSKKVWQRVLVISAGVIMNVIFALVVLPIAFSVGIPFEKPVLGVVHAGSPAWDAGLRTRDRVLQIDGRKVLGFGDIPQDAAVSDGPMTFSILRDGVEQDIIVKARDWRDRGFPEIGVDISYSGFRPANPDEGELSKEIRDGMKALSDQGLTHDRPILAVNGVPVEEHYWMRRELDRARSADEPLTFTVKKSEGSEDIVLQPRWEDEKKSRIGVVRGGPLIKQVRAGGAASRAGLAKGDIIRSINGTALGLLTDVPRLLGEGVNIFSDAPRSGPPANPQIVLEVARASGDGDGRAVTSRQVRIDLPSWEDRRAFVGDIAWAGVEANTFWVQPGSPAAEAGLRSGDIVVTVGGKPSKGLETLTEAFDPEAEVQKPIEMVVLRDDGRKTVTVTAKKLPRNIYAALAFELEIPREDVTVPFSESFGVGVIHTGRMINRVVSTLGSLIRGRVSPKHLGGIITIFRVSKQTSKIAFMRLLLFLAMVSINLAILNILPIPVLDGGWLVFLIIEKIKGSPVTETTMAYFQWAGLIFILSLMGYVTWNDIQRLISGS